jgi:hypothetical protein
MMIVSRLHQWLVVVTGLRVQSFGMDNALSRLPEDIVEREYGEFFKSSALNLVEMARTLCDEVGLNGAEREAKRLTDQIARGMIARVLSTSLTHLHDRIVVDTEDIHAVHTSGEMAKLLSEDNGMAFHPAVKERLPAAAREMADGAACLALGMGTASVFHMMRATELGVQALGAKMKIDPTTSNWSNIMEQVDKKLKDMPSKTGAQRQKKNLIALASAHLQVVRMAWRNEVMHPHRVYSLEDAQVIFAATRAFMLQLSLLLPKKRVRSAN